MSASQQGQRRDAQGPVLAEKLLAVTTAGAGRGNFLQGCGPPGPTVHLQRASHLGITDLDPMGYFKGRRRGCEVGKDMFGGNGGGDQIH